MGEKVKLLDTQNKIFFSLAGIIIFTFLYTRVKDILNSFKTDRWPPEVDECPNMWLKVGPKKCRNVLGIGNKNCDKKINFGEPQYNDPRAKCKWAKYTCNVDWDGYDKLC